jgi:hypothetical protein
MKRFLTLLLATAMVLSFAACGDNGTTIRNENEKDNVKKDPIAAQYLQDLAVKTADYPVLPAMPNEAELDEAFSTIDYDKMGADAYEKAQEKIWEDWDARSNAYYDALKAQQGHELPRGVPALYKGDGHAAFGGGEYRPLAREPVPRLCDAQRDDGRRQPRAAFIALRP